MEKYNYKDELVNSSFKGIVRTNEDGSKTCCGYLHTGKEGTTLMTFYSDVSPNGLSTFNINDYGTTLSLKILLEFGKLDKLCNYMDQLVEFCASKDNAQIKDILSHIGNVTPEWNVEKFIDPSYVFKQMENGLNISEIVGPGKNFYHNHMAFDQIPTFDSFNFENENENSPKSL